MAETRQAGKKHVRAVLIDWDFTLSQHNLRWVQNAGEKLRHLKGAKVEKTHVACVGDTPKDKSRAKGTNRFYRWANARLMEGSKETVEWLLEQNIPVFIVSNAPQGALNDQVKNQLGEALAAKVPHYGSNTCTTSRKPHPEAFLRVLKEHNVPVGRDVFMIGDRTQFDFAPAYEIGLTPILFNPSAGDKAKGEKYAKDHQMFEFYCVKAHPELRTLLGEIMNRGSFSAPAESRQRA